MNHVVLLGRIVRPQEIREAKGVEVLNNVLAVKDTHRENQVAFVPFTAWGKLARLLYQYVQKGERVGIMGRIDTRHYTDKNGEEVYVMEVIVQEVHFIERKQKETPKEASVDVFGDL